jgi:hypothetical protein
MKQLLLYRRERKDLVKRLQANDSKNKALEIKKG